MEQITLDAQIASLFVPEERGVFTCAAGYSHARYEQYTELSQHLHAQMLGILDACGVGYYLFAGSMVGYVRNGKMPYWMDDLDIMIFPDQVRQFEDVALPVLRETGFNCWEPGPYKGGGYHMLSMQQGNSRKLSIPLSDRRQVSVPWAQVDAFYSIVDDKGFIRNPGNWGLYHVKEVPADWVHPGRFVEIGDLRVRAFSRLEEDIRKEYGDVVNNIVIYSHGSTFLRANNTPWPKFEREFLRFLQQTSSSLPEGIEQSALDAYAPDPARTYRCTEKQSFSSICRGILEERAGTVRLADGEQTFWAMDFKRLFGTLRVEGMAHSVLQAQRAAHLRTFVDAMEFTSDEARAEHDRCVAGLRRVLGH